VWLAELVQSMAAAGVDHVVAVDGAYAAYPHRSPVSDPGQAQAIVETACGAGVGCSVYVPSVAWHNGEIQKRTFLFAAGHVVCVPGRDWFWVLDGDEVITHHHGLKDILAATTRDVGTVNLWEGAGEHTLNSQPLRMLFRSQPSGIRVGGYHAHYRTGNGDVLWNPSGPRRRRRRCSSSTRCGCVIAPVNATSSAHGTGWRTTTVFVISGWKGCRDGPGQHQGLREVSSRDRTCRQGRCQRTAGGS
jgi:hypothetical protein